MNRYEVEATGTMVMSTAGTAVVDLNKGDYISIRAYQSSGAALALDGATTLNKMSITRQGF